MKNYEMPPNIRESLSFEELDVVLQWIQEEIADLLKEKVLEGEFAKVFKAKQEQLRDESDKVVEEEQALLEQFVIRYQKCYDFSTERGVQGALGQKTEPAARLATAISARACANSPS